MVGMNNCDLIIVMMKMITVFILPLSHPILSVFPTSFLIYTPSLSLSLSHLIPRLLLPLQILSLSPPQHYYRTFPQYGHTALHKAVSACHEDIVKLLLDNGAWVNTVNGVSGKINFILFLFIFLLYSCYLVLYLMFFFCYFLILTLYFSYFSSIYVYNK